MVPKVTCCPPKKHIRYKLINLNFKIGFMSVFLSTLLQLIHMLDSSFIPVSEKSSPIYPSHYFTMPYGMAHTVNVLTIFTVSIMSLFCQTLFHWQVHFLIGENHNHLLLLPALLNSFSYDTCYQIPRLSDWLVSNVTHNRKYIIKLYFTIHYSSTFISLNSLFSIG